MLLETVFYQRAAKACQNLADRLPPSCFLKPQFVKSECRLEGNHA